MSKVRVPTLDTFMNPLIQALNQLDGSGTIEEIVSKTAEIVSLSDEQRVFLMRLRQQPRGIFGSGTVIVKPYEDIHGERS